MDPGKQALVGEESSDAYWPFKCTKTSMLTWGQGRMKQVGGATGTGGWEQEVGHSSVCNGDMGPDPS